MACDTKKLTVPALPSNLPSLFTFGIAPICLRERREPACILLRCLPGPQQHGLQNLKSKVDEEFIARETRDGEPRLRSGRATLRGSRQGPGQAAQVCTFSAVENHEFQMAMVEKTQLG